MGSTLRQFSSELKQIGRSIVDKITTAKKDTLQYFSSY